MNNTPAFIWDLDGTLLDSYPIIASSLKDALSVLGYESDPEELMKVIRFKSVNDYISLVNSRCGIDEKAAADTCRRIRRGRLESTGPMEHAVSCLAALAENGCRHFVYTHSGSEIIPVLEKAGLLPYFTEVLTIESGFARKPDPEAINYLLNKYELSRDNCYYVGDRELDILAARNAEIGGILFIPDTRYGTPTGFEKHVVYDLNDIPALFF